MNSPSEHEPAPDDEYPEMADTNADAEASEDAAEGHEGSVEDQLAEANDKLLRALAEVQNTRRRARLDLDDAHRYSAAPVLSEIVHVIDNLQRAVATAPEGTDPSFLDGLTMIEQSMVAILGNHGVTPIDAQRGQMPDPTVHRVLLQQEDTELEPGAITAEIMRGYRLHDRLLREAQVAVAKAPSDDA